MKVKSQSEVIQLCLTLGDPMDCSLPGSSIHGIFQARVLEWGAIAFSDIPYYPYSTHDLAPPTVLSGLLLRPWTWVSFFGGLQHPPVGSGSAVSRSFGVLAGEDERTSFYSAIC